MDAFPAAPTPVLDPAEARALDAALAAILPSDSGPGAAEAGAGRYVAGRLAGPDRHWLDPLRRWLAAAPLADAATPLADAAAAAVAALAGAGAGTDGAALFEQLRLWAWSGYLCDPAHGGNAGGVGWARFDWSPPAGRRAVDAP